MKNGSNWIQVIPRNDLRPHEELVDCWCKPEVDCAEGMIIHNALDGREKLETGEEKLH